MTEHAVKDQVTFEVLVNRLRTINYNQGVIGKRISGSQMIYECGDYNCSIMDAEGDVLFLGHYNTMMGSAMDRGVKWIIENYGEDPGINPGDVFYYNDPWIGTLHQSDCVGVAPIFAGDRLIAWTAMVMHEMDVGGVVPGSFAVGYSETFAESTIITPVKIVEGGTFRRDIERAIVRNSRVPDLLALDLRARLGAFNFAKKAIGELVEKYGLDTLLGVMQEVKSFVRARLGARLQSLPDGQWHRVLYWDGDGTTDQVYTGVLTFSKTGTQLHFDFSGTSPQAVGGINCTRAGLEGAVTVGLLCTICFDLPWATSSFREFIDVTIDEGTIFTALPPAPVSGATVAAGFLCMNLVQACVSEMLLGHPELGREAMAPWMPAWTGSILAGLDYDGNPMATILNDGILGGEGACNYRDGQDVGGMFSGISLECANVERNERVLPILQLARNILPDSCGHGEFRGGGGTVTMWTPHKTVASLTEVMYSAYFEQMFPGLAGASGAPVMSHRIARGTDLQERMKSGVVPVNLDEVSAETIENHPCKGMTQIQEGDLHYMPMTGGGGYGDPLDRVTASVVEDVQTNHYSAEIALSIYGCVLDELGQVDGPATEAERARLRQVRLSEGRPVREILGLDPSADVATGGPTGQCRNCDHQFTSSDPRLEGVTRARHLSEFSPLNQVPPTDKYRLWEFYCPYCGHLFASEVLQVEEDLSRAFALAGMAPEAH
jgi:N-methylhydantoinase B